MRPVNPVQQPAQQQQTAFQQQAPAQPVNPVAQQQVPAQPVNPIQFGSMPPMQGFQQPASMQQQAQPLPAHVPAQQPVQRNLFPGTPQNAPLQPPLQQPMPNVFPSPVGMPPQQQPAQFNNPQYMGNVQTNAFPFGAPTGNVAMQPAQQPQPFLPNVNWSPGRAGGVYTMPPNQAGGYLAPTSNYATNAPSTPANAAATAVIANVMMPQGNRNPGGSALDTFKCI